MTNKKRLEIRIVNPDTTILSEVRRLAKVNKRTMGKQAEFMLHLFISQKKNKQ